ncbi:hypothetical protein EYC80_005159 [Monilinia laxa]|uniref:Uncharacterized protein n=1 Tax=Monilinia laxa TaxID=61186 RepID=A0A5N6KJM0_MONLA|nr:hypothetical protein EYC80_005159 [Monilinia laxa]
MLYFFSVGSLGDVHTNMGRVYAKVPTKENRSIFILNNQSAAPILDISIYISIKCCYLSRPLLNPICI